MKYKILIFLFFSICFEIFAKGDVEKKEVTAYEILCNAEIVQIVSMNETGKLFPNIKAFYFLLKEWSPLLFIDLYNNAKTNEGRIYALIGLYFCNDIYNYNNKKKEIENQLVYIASADVKMYMNTCELLVGLENGKLKELLFWNVDITTWEIIKREKIFSDLTIPPVWIEPSQINK
jgi:hypothetical protein